MSFQVEFLIYEGADLSLLASKRDVAKGAKLTPRQLAEAIQFEPMDIFDKTPPPLIGQKVSPPPADSPPPNVNPSPPPAPQPKSPTPPPSVPPNAPATTEGGKKKMPSTEEELEAMIQARIDKALAAKMDEIMKMAEGNKAPAKEEKVKSDEDLEVEAAMNRMRAEEALERAGNQ